MTCCRNCGEDVGLALLGRDENKFTCRSCSTVSFGSKKCLKCDSRDGSVSVIGDQEKLPTEICDKCQAQAKAMAEVVRDGGIYFHCKDCPANGVIRAQSDLAVDVRRHMGIEAPDPCGVELDKTSCPACGPVKVEPGLD